MDNQARDSSDAVMPSSRPIRVLILGGTSEASALAAALAQMKGIAATISFAGRTVGPIVQPIPTRIGGFGGSDGLAAYLSADKIDILVDATHPFATQMSAQARAAAQRTGCRLLRIVRPAWRAAPGDDWREYQSMADAVAALGSQPRRVFLTIGSLQLAAFAAAPHHTYLIRTIDPVAQPPDLPNGIYITGRGPFLVEEEMRLMRDYRIEVLVTKNSGGSAAKAKLDAARRLGLPIVLVSRPEDIASADATPESAVDDGLTYEEALAAIRHRVAVRGV